MLTTRNSRIGNRDFQPVEVLPVCQTGARAGVGGWAVNQPRVHEEGVSRGTGESRHPHSCAVDVALGVHERRRARKVVSVASELSQPRGGLQEGLLRPTVVRTVAAVRTNRAIAW